MAAPRTPYLLRWVRTTKFSTVIGTRVAAMPYFLKKYACAMPAVPAQVPLLGTGAGVSYLNLNISSYGSLKMC
eukprot:SAG31_NODE_19191_length_609_cov_2.327451_1_plen_73_part_00